MIDRLIEFINSKAGYLSLFWAFSLLAVFFIYGSYQKNQIKFIMNMKNSKR
jgi:hypothetical protein